MTGKTYFSFQKLDVYQQSKQLVKQVYGLLSSYPADERYALCDQMRRAAISIPSNIAEGLSRYSPKEQIHFLEIAYGSLSEIVCQLEISEELGYIRAEHYEQLMLICLDLGRMLSNMRSFREKQMSNREAEPRISPITATEGCSKQ